MTIDPTRLVADGRGVHRGTRPVGRRGPASERLRTAREGFAHVEPVIAKGPDPLVWAAIGNLLGETGQGIIRELTLIQEQELQLEAIAGPEAAPALIDRARREYRRLADAAMETPYEATRLSTILRSYVRTLAKGDQP